MLSWLAVLSDKIEVFNQGGQEFPDSSIMDGIALHGINLEAPGQMHGGGKKKNGHTVFFLHRI